MAESEAYYTDEDVIGSANKYHRPSCWMVKKIPNTNRKRLQNWEVAAAIGLMPCSLCNPFYLPPVKQQPKRKIGF